MHAYIRWLGKKAVSFVVQTQIFSLGSWLLHLMVVPLRLWVSGDSSKIRDFQPK